MTNIRGDNTMNNIFNLNMVSTFINKCTFIFLEKIVKKIIIF